MVAKKKICPIMSRKCTVSCREDCVAWVPEQTHEFRCTCDIKNEESCHITQVVEIPENVVLFCDGCKFFKSFKIKPVPAHCALMGSVKAGVIW